MMLCYLGKVCRVNDALTTIIKELEEQYIPSKIVDVNGDDRFGEK